MQGSCNICGGGQFAPYRGRPAERCTRCGAKARHRIALEVYRRFLEPLRVQPCARLLHLAPEAPLYPFLRDWFGAGYFCADPAPERYPHAQVLRLELPEGFGLFPDGYFSAIAHNHVLEHIPGSYRDHLAQFARILRPGGCMAFSIPGPYSGRPTQEGGEFLANDAERLAKFLQEDHLKLFGDDFIPFLQQLPGGRLFPDGHQRRAELAVRPGKARFFIWRKDG